MTDSSAILETACRIARMYGSANGASAGRAYSIDTREDARVLADVLAGEDLAGDHGGTRAERVRDSLPFADLSGEWADTMTGPELFAECIAQAYRDAGAIMPEDAFDTLGYAFGNVCDAYDAGFQETAESIIARRARYIGGLAGAVDAFVVYVPGRPTFYILADVCGVPRDAVERAADVARAILAGAGVPAEHVSCTAVTL